MPDSLEIGNLMYSYLDRYIKKEKIITCEDNNSKLLCDYVDPLLKILFLS